LIDENRLTQTSRNKNLYSESGDYIVMIVAGPNARKDFHYNETEELFYQLEGSISNRSGRGSEKKSNCIPVTCTYIRQNAAFSSSFRRFDRAGNRAKESFTDGLLWYCDNCNHKLHEVYFELNNIEKTSLPHFEDFYKSLTLRTHEKCGTVMDTDPRFIVKK
jgi:3-hydroxyanthranilate 3,4-dioxygenase